MIKLFNIPNHSIDTCRFDNLLHGKTVREFEDKFTEYVGAKYGCSLHSATDAITIIYKHIVGCQDTEIPSVIPAVVSSTICRIAKERQLNWSFCDNIDWVGSAYVLYSCLAYQVIDSAQQVDRNQYRTMMKQDRDLMIFSHYPTKPVGSCNGGMVVSNDKETIEKIRILANDGFANSEKNSWDRELKELGYKMSMNSIEAFIALRNLEKLDAKKARLNDIRNQYNARFGLKNTSDHLYRITVGNNRRFVEQAKQAGVICGIHYQCEHFNPVYNLDNIPSLPLSERAGKTTVSIPFHEALEKKEVEAVINLVLTEYEHEQYS